MHVKFTYRLWHRNHHTKTKWNVTKTRNCLRNDYLNSNFCEIQFYSTACHDFSWFARTSCTVIVNRWNWFGEKMTDQTWFKPRPPESLVRCPTHWAFWCQYVNHGLICHYFSYYGTFSVVPTQGQPELTEKLLLE